MNKKGFTLIELLAVILVLALIITIVTPILTNTISKSKESIYKSDIKLYAESIKKAVLAYEIKYKVMPTDLTQIKQFIKKEGNEVSCEVVKIYDRDNIYLEKCTVDGKEVKDFTYGQQPICTLIEGKEKEIGAKYECNFGDGVRNFYILEKGTNPVTGSTLKSDEVALILDGNYDTDTLPWCDQSGPNPSNNACNADGLTEKLDEIASVWTKLERSQIVLPSAVQIVVADGLSEDAYEDYPTLTNTWLYEWTGNNDYNNGDGPSYGYWTSSAHSDVSLFAWLVSCYGVVYNDYVDRGVRYGVRPVINLKL